jgi:hypothetical protein
MQQALGLCQGNMCVCMGLDLDAGFPDLDAGFPDLDGAIPDLDADIPDGGP